MCCCRAKVCKGPQLLADLRCVVIHCLLSCKIAFVPDEQFVHVLARTSVDLVQPLLHVVEGIGIRHVIHDDDTVRSTVVAASDCPEALLSRGVPYL